MDQKIKITDGQNVFVHKRFILKEKPTKEKQGSKCQRFSDKLIVNTEFPY